MPLGNQEKKLLGWSCTKCTYYHHAPASRCVMCDELRESKKDIHDFILGKPIPPRQEGNFVELLDDSPSPPRKKTHRPIQNEDSTNRKPSASSSTNIEESKPSIPVANPYTNNSRTTAAASIFTRQNHQEQGQKPGGLATIDQGLPQNRPSNSVSVAQTGRAAKVQKAATSTGLRAFFNPYSVNKENSEQNHNLQQQHLNQKRPPNLSTSGNSFSSSSAQTNLNMPRQQQLQQNPTTREHQRQHQDIAAQRQVVDSSMSCNPPIQPQHLESVTPRNAAAPSLDGKPPARVASNIGCPSVGRAAPPPFHRDFAGTVPQINVQNDITTNIPRYAQVVMRDQFQTGEPVTHGNSYGRTPVPASALMSRTGQSNEMDGVELLALGKNPFSLAARTRHDYVAGPVPFREGTSDHWIYPKNKDYPIRQYQLEIAETAIKYNTLVSLPTGLGKTLIAAVVMYNYYRWFPQGKVVFLAPSLPLVSQQLQACWNIMGIPEIDTAEMTGKSGVAKRREFWETKRAFFCTPQTIQNDIKSGTFPDASKVVCVVFDEAHKATKEYAYTKIIEQLDYACAKYRVLGLSATPGTSIKKIQEVVDKLRISKIAFRAENDPTVKPYVHGRETEVVIVKRCSFQNDIINDLINVIREPLDRLRDQGAMDRHRFAGYNLGAYQLKMAQEEFERQRDRRVRGNSHQYLMIDFFAAMSIAGLIEQARGSASVALRGVIEVAKANRGYMRRVISSAPFQELLEKARAAGAVSKGEGNSDSTKSNAKVTKLVEILTEHFERARACGKSSRAIVFAELRDFVSEIVDALGQQPMIRPRHFVGQSKSSTTESSNGEGSSRLKGMKQSEQQQAIREFRNDVYNVLVCTCIGEEGLDIGEVDLIVMFDTLRSPIRMIQRTGRTGRKRSGRVVCLVGEGQEQRKYEGSKEAEKTLQRAMKNSSNFNMHPNIPMFEAPPARKDMEMDIGSQFHMSQVGGHVRLRSSANSRQKCSDSWKLTDDQEKVRRRILGPISEMRTLDSLSMKNTTGLPVPFRRWLLRSRTLSISRCSSSRPAFFHSGRIVDTLRQIESFPNGNVVENHVTRRAKPAARGGHETLHKLFPLEYVESAENFSDVDDGEHSSDECVSHNTCEVPISNERTTAPTSTNRAIDGYYLHHTVMASSNRRQDSCDTEPKSNTHVPYQRLEEASVHDVFKGTGSESITKHQTYSDILADNYTVDINGVQRDKHIISRQGDPRDESTEGKATLIRSVDTPAGPHQNLLIQEGASAEQVSIQEKEIDAHGIQQEPQMFRLPTPPPSSSSSSSGNDESDSENEVWTDPGQKYQDISAPRRQEQSVPTQGLVIEVDMGTETITDTNEDFMAQNGNDPPPPQEEPFIRLPTQDSSSSEDDASSDENATILESEGCHGEATRDIVGETTNNGADTTDLEDDDIPLISLRVKRMESEKLISNNLASNLELSNIHQQNICFQVDKNGSLESPLGSKSANFGLEPTVEKAERSLTQDAHYPETHQNNVAGGCNHPETAETPRKILPEPSIKATDREDIVASQKSTSFESPEVLVIRPNRKRRGHVVGDDHSQSSSTTDGDKRQRMTSSPEVTKRGTLVDTPGSQDEKPIPGVVQAERDSRNLDIDIELSEGKVDPFQGRQMSSKIDSPDGPLMVRPNRRRQQFVILDEDTQPLSSQTSTGRPAVLETPCRTHTKELMDTPVDDGDNSNKQDVCLLNDTPSVHGSHHSVALSPDGIVCAVCLSDESDDNPIVLCDQCQIGFHQSCYSFSVDLNADDDWFCDVCNYQHSLQGGSSKDFVERCSYCRKRNGPFKRGASNTWYHPYCARFSSLSQNGVACDSCSEKGAISCIDCAASIHVHCAIQDKRFDLWTFARVAAGCDKARPNCAAFCPRHSENVSKFVVSQGGANQNEFSSSMTIVMRTRTRESCRDNGAPETKRLRKFIPSNGTTRANKLLQSVPAETISEHENKTDHKEDPAAKRQRMDRRRAAMARFIDEEAKINSDDDPDGDEMEELEARRIEEDEGSDDSFINDSLNLTQYTQDELTRADPDAAFGGDLMHRAVDIERELRNQFATPVLNRRTIEDTPESAPSSQRGLGRMHFIRSVLEHHKNGGNADEIEKVFHELQRGNGGGLSQDSEATENHQLSPNRPARSVAMVQSRSVVSRGPSRATNTVASASGSSSGLTDEQRRKIEANRLAALRRQKQLRR